MKKLALSFACWDYDRTRALADGTVRPDGIWDVVHFLQMLSDPRGRKLLQLYDPTIKFEP